MIDREVLEKATIEQLQREARRLQLDICNDRDQLIAAILTYYERSDLQITPSVPQKAAGGARDQRGPFVPRRDTSEPLTAGMFQQVLSELSSVMTRQQQEMLRMQQKFMQQMLQQLAPRNPERAASQDETAAGSGGEQSLERNNTGSSSFNVPPVQTNLNGQNIPIVTNMSALPTGNAVT